MYDNAICILKKLNDNGFESYIVGGYPRDKYLGIMSTDIDICTSATPHDVASLFSDVDITNSSYGSVRIKYNGYVYEVTTFRCDKSMMDGNRYYDVIYVDTLKEDLFRRDFVINTLCIDYNGEYVDCLGAIHDIENRLIHTVKDASVSFKEDPLRMLRAIRFSTVLSFDLCDEICNAIYEFKENLTKLSKTRIKKELDIIYNSPNYMSGILLLKRFGIDKVLQLSLDWIVYW